MHCTLDFQIPTSDKMMLAKVEIGFSEVTVPSGLDLYLIVGVIGTGITAQFYHHFEVKASRTGGLSATH